MSYVVGADPGLKGGLALCRIDGPQTCFIAGVRMPTRKERGRDCVDGRRLRAVLTEWWNEYKHGAPGTVIIEQVGAMPEQGVTSAFRFGQASGVLIGVLETMYTSSAMISVTPNVWKKAMGLSSDKRGSLDLAARLWPAEFTGAPLADDGIAEAALMVHWWRERHNGP